MSEGCCFTKILKNELILSCGCTEPVAVAYGAARAREILGKDPTKITVACSKNFIKNALSVFIPNANGMKGIAAAAVLGSLVGTTKLGFEIFSKVDEKICLTAENLLKDPAFCKIAAIDTPHKVHIVVEAFATDKDGKTERVLVEIKDKHTNISRAEKNGVTLPVSPDMVTSESLESCYEQLNFKSIMDFIENTNLEPFLALLDMQMEFNYAIAVHGINGEYGIKLHEYYLKKDPVSLEDLMLAMTTAASEARMSGCELPVVINSGSGNQGITISVPLIITARELAIPKERLYRAILLSNLMNIYEKRFIGELSAYCGVASAACSVAAGLTYLKGGNREQISMALRNHIAGVSGMLCDGAKNTCAIKIATALSGAFAASDRALAGKTYAPYEGILKPDIDETIEALGKIASVGMLDTDDTILDVLLGD